MLSSELNSKFNFHSFPHPHKEYWCIKIPLTDPSTLRDLISPHMLESFSYKIPNSK
jgi:hypothetical protein